MKANAVVFTKPNTVSFQEVDCSDPNDEQLVVRVTRSWISNGTEGSYLRGERVEAIAERFPDGAQVGMDTVGSIAVMERLQASLRRFGHLVSAGCFGDGDLAPERLSVRNRKAADEGGG